jgi:hypothetical protein
MLSRGANTGNVSCVKTRQNLKAGSLIAQVTTDVRSSTLGVAVLCAAEAGLIVSEIDHGAGRTVQCDSGLELYHSLWQEPGDDDELIPTRGCSGPTFHGSAADLAGAAATLVNLIGSHLQQPDPAVSGTHLIALPHAASGPRHHSSRLGHRSWITLQGQNEGSETSKRRPSRGDCRRAPTYATNWYQCRGAPIRTHRSTLPQAVCRPGRNSSP